MPGRIEKTVFISYRRTNLPWALAIYQNLTAHEHDVFFDYNSIKSGDFEQIIIQNIKGRAHFVVLLTPSALERSAEPEDWLRREIELAIDEKRNIVPLFFEGFSFGSPSVAKYLTGKLKLLKKYNGMTVPSEYFEAAMLRLRNDFLNVPLNAVLHPISIAVGKAVKAQQVAASQATKVQQKELTAQEWYEQALTHDFAKNYEGAIDSFTEAIRLKPDFFEAYFGRGVSSARKGDLAGAVHDYHEALHLNSNFIDARVGLMSALRSLGRLDDVDKQAKLARPFMEKVSKYNQACFEALCGDTDRALALLKIAIEGNPDYAVTARIDPDFEYIHHDPRFKELVGQ
jgi:tetratricopeptide (TPR) repeat protein